MPQTFRDVALLQFGVMVRIRGCYCFDKQANQVRSSAAPLPMADGRSFTLCSEAWVPKPPAQFQQPAPPVDKGK